MKKILFASILIIISTFTLSFAEFPAVEVYESTSKNVVLIVARGKDSGSMVGAGSVISDSGLVVTNAHVVFNDEKTEPLENITVYLKPEKVTGKFRKDLVNRYEAELKAFDVDLDLAVLKVRKLPAGTGTVKLASPEEIRIGEEVVTIGHPEQGGLWTLTYGRISGEILDQNSINGKDVYQTDASVNRGNSGGPLLDRRGYMVGINTNIARLGAGNLPITGVNFAVKSSVMKKWFEQQNIDVEYGSKPLHEMQQELPDAKEEQKKAEVPDVQVKAETDDEKTATDSEPEKIPDDGILTPKRPYSFDDLFRQTEEEMEDMMEEMKGRIGSWK